jgi:molybdenum cofactor biosynthesis protein A
MALFDNHGRPLNYLRLAVTDRCNLRCFYCMPAEGIKYLPKKELLTYEEMEKLISILASMGISKIRITGGEPFVRNDLMTFLRKVTEIPGVKDVHLTTNGVLTAPHVPELKKLGIASVNLSLDTMNRERFKAITLRDEFESTYKTLNSLLHHHIPVKINTVVMDNKNIDDLYPMIELTKHNALSVRFIEEMPFNGEGSHYPKLTWTHVKILEYFKKQYPDLIKIQDPMNSTAYHYKIPGYAGDIGIIAAFSRTFCGTCNRLRVTAQGILKTCLYDEGVLDIKSLLRAGVNTEKIKEHLHAAFSTRAANGWEAETRRNKNYPVHESMSTIGG